jgi:probable HAF family extracellular repeat protein
VQATGVPSWIALSLGSVPLALFAVRGATPTAELIPLGDLPGGSVYSEARGVSTGGAVVTGRSTSDAGLETFVWTLSGGMVPIGSLVAAGDSLPYGISADGTVVSGESETLNGSSAVGAADRADWCSSTRTAELEGIPPPGTEAFIWSQATGMVGLGDVSGGYFHSSTHGLSRDGLVAHGESYSAEGWEAFVWTESGGMVGIGDLPGGPFGSYGHGISDDGSTSVGHSDSEQGPEAYRWTAAGGLQGLGALDPAATYSRANGASFDGGVIVGESGIGPGPGTEAFRWTEAGGMVSLGELPGGNVRGRAWRCSSDGKVVVGDSDGPLGPQAFIWTEAQGMQALQDVLASRGVDLSGWVLQMAFDVSPDGNAVVGWGTNPLGATEAYLAILGETPSVPSSGGWGLAALAALLLLVAAVPRRHVGRR